VRFAYPTPRKNTKDGAPGIGGGDRALNGEGSHQEACAEMCELSELTPLILS
jgi:hypothetical protein